MNFKKINEVLTLVRNKNYLQAKARMASIVRDDLSDSSKITYDKLTDILSKSKDSTSGKLPQISSTNDTSSTHPSLVYCILAMENEIDVLKMTVSPLIQQLGPNDACFILFNGFVNHALKLHFQKHTGIKVWESSINLGVAGGRNLLYAEAMKNITPFDYVVTLDNDVIVPNDFSEVIKQELQLNYDKNNIGIMGSVILDYKKQKVKKFISDNFLGFPGYLSSINYNIFTDDITEFVTQNAEKLNTVLWHIGVEKNYLDAYVERTDLCQRFRGEVVTYHPFLAHAPCNTDLIKQDLFEVSNVPGCLQVISMSNLKKAGLLDNRFSPYFFEDSEMSIRLMNMGMKNYISTKIALFHGTDDRHNDRKKISSKFEFITNENRARIILLNKLGIENPIKKLVAQSIMRYALESKSAKALPEFIAALVGIRRGMMQLNMVDIIGGDGCPEDLNILNILNKKIDEGNTATKNLREIKSDPSLPALDAHLPQVYYSQFKKFKNIYEGQDCLIVCNGPSLKDTNLGLFAGMPTFCVNSTFILQDELDFTPEFFTVEDNHVIDDNLDNILKMRSGFKFFPHKYREKFGDQEDIYYLQTIWDCYWKSKISHEYPEFSVDVPRGVYTGQTVTYLNLQLAYYMGFKRVFIVGLDFSYSIPKGSKIDNNSIDHEDDDPNHFHANYFGKGRQWHFPKLDSCMSSYSIARERFSRSGREVIDLTKNGRLNVFRKSTVEQELGWVDRPVSVEKGLDFKQYLIDVIYAKFCHKNDRHGELMVQQDKGFKKSDSHHLGVWFYSDVASYKHSLITAVSNAAKGDVVAYLDKSMFVIGNAIDVHELPFCNWISSQVNVKYVEQPNFDKDSFNFLTKNYVVFLPNNSNGICYLEKALAELSQSRVILFADQDRILLKNIG